MQWFKDYRSEKSSEKIRIHQKNVKKPIEKNGPKKNSSNKNREKNSSSNIKVTQKCYKPKFGQTTSKKVYN